MGDKHDRIGVFDPYKRRAPIFVTRAYDRKREFGYYVLPILHCDRLIGRIDPFFDRRAGVLRVNAVYAEPGAPPDAWPSVRGAIDDLAAWTGASEVTLPRLPLPWR